MRIQDMFPMDGSSLNDVTEFYAGIECEIESVQGNPHFINFNTTQDGSLRNNGLEFISIPMNFPHLLTSFKHLQEGLVFNNKQDAFSPRTSTHVHINCRTLTEEQTKTLLLLYALFEEFFFMMVDGSRRGNIHCVPLTETYLPSMYKHGLSFLVEKWHKYTALNLVPLMKQGSIEFRHLQGTGDAVLLEEWLLVLSKLWSMAQQRAVLAEILTDTPQLKLMWQQLFGHSKRIMALEPSFENMIANSLLDVKFAFIKG